MPETRKESRLPLVLAVRYREPTMTEPREAECQDLAPGGMFVMTVRPSARGALLRFDSISAGAEDTFSGTARVVWQRTKADPRGPAGMGVRFIRLEPGSREVVMRLVARLAAEQNPGSSPPARRSSRPPKTKSQPAANTARPQSDSTNLGATQQGIGSRSEPSGLRAQTLRGIAVQSGSPPSLPPSAASLPETDERSTLPSPAVAPPPGPPAAQIPSQLPARRIDPGALRERLGTTLRSNTPAIPDQPTVVRAVTTPSPPPPSPLPPQAPPSTPVPVRKLSETIIGVGTASSPRDRRSERPPSPGGVDDLRPIVGIPIRQASEPAPSTTRASPSLEADSPAPEARAAPSSRPPISAPQADPPQAFAQAPSPAPIADVRIEPPAQHAQPVREPAPQPYVQAESAARDPLPPRARMGQRTQEPIATLPAYAGTASPLDTKRIAWIVAGVGVIVSLALSRVVGSSPVRLPELGDDPKTAASPASASQSAATEQPTRAPTQAATPTASVAAAQYAVDVGSEPSGARVSAVGRSVITPGRLSLGTLTGTITATAELDGYRSVTAQLSPAEFNLDGDLYLRKLVVKLDAESPVPDAAPVAAAVQAVARVGITPTPVPARAPKKTGTTKPAGPKPRPGPPKPVPAQATAKAVPTTETSPAPAADAPDAKPLTPLQTASACLAQGDNACVIRALEDHANTAQASEMLIETYRAIGSVPRAEREMKRYIRDFPNEKRAAEFQRKLAQQTPSPP